MRSIVVGQHGLFHPSIARDSTLSETTVRGGPPVEQQYPKSPQKMPSNHPFHNIIKLYTVGILPNGSYRHMAFIASPEILLETVSLHIINRCTDLRRICPGPGRVLMVPWAKFGDDSIDGEWTTPMGVRQSQDHHTKMIRMTFASMENLLR